MDERSPASFVMKENEKCDFYISSYESTSGILENPKHSLPPNTTCRYHFTGKPNEIVWLAFVKYYAATSDSTSSLAGEPSDATGTECNVKLLIWNGERISTKKSSTSRFMAHDVNSDGMGASSSTETKEVRFVIIIRKIMQ